MTTRLSPEICKSILTEKNAANAWQSIYTHLHETWTVPMEPAKAPQEVVKRERTVHEVDLCLSSAAWDLWEHYPDAAVKTSQRLKDWWQNTPDGKAILILDGMSLRELPWIIRGAKDRGFSAVAHVTGAEVPSDTTSFAQALGFDQRSRLENNRGKSESFFGAVVETDKLPWSDCIGLIKNHSNVIFWHHWPDNEMHSEDGAGVGAQRLAKKASEELRSDDFWRFVEKLCTGRKLIITSDHGYAISSNFSDHHNQDAWLQQNFKKQRYTDAISSEPPFLLPLVLEMRSTIAKPIYCINGRWKWRIQGGFPVLSHGGLTLLEMTVPFIEITKN